MPEAPPVTIATRPSKSIDTILTHEVWDHADTSIHVAADRRSILGVGVRGGGRVDRLRPDSAGRTRAQRDHQRVDGRIPPRSTTHAASGSSCTTPAIMSANLLGWSLSDDVHDKFVLPSIDIAPGQYIVLARQKRLVRQRRRHTADRLRQRDRAQREERSSDPARRGVDARRDRVDWTAGFTVPEGASMSLSDPKADNNKGSNWCTSVSVMRRGDLGSPGAANRCQPSTQRLVITEIMQNPRLIADDRGEYFEVYNPDDQPVDMTGFTIKDDDYDSFTVTTAVIVPAQGLRTVRQQADVQRRPQARLLVRQRHDPAERHRRTGDRRPRSRATRSRSLGQRQDVPRSRRRLDVAARSRASTTASAPTGAPRPCRGSPATAARPGTHRGASAPASSRS